MTIITKYSPDTEVWYINANTIFSDTIQYVDIKVLPVKEGVAIIDYDLKGRNDRKFKEKELFPTKEALLQSL